MPRCGRRERGGAVASPQWVTSSVTSTAMSYPVVSQPQCASSCHQTQLSDWHTGLSGLSICPLHLQVCPGKWGWEARSPPTPTDTLPTPPFFFGLWISTSIPQPFFGLPTLLGILISHLPTLNFLDLQPPSRTPNSSFKPYFSTFKALPPGAPSSLWDLHFLQPVCIVLCNLTLCID